MEADKIMNESASSDTRRRIERGRAMVEAVRREVGKLVVGQRETLDGVLVALLAGGHVLIEGVPGLGKTLLVRTLADSLGLTFKRIQCTPDLMPADVLGTRILVEEPDGRRRYEFQAGPVFTQVLLADEINRATPKTQSALLEAMQECAVTVAGEQRVLEAPFFVLATQNPIEMEGTFPLPEAQLDRFLFKLLMEFPPLEDLEAIVDRTTGPEAARAVVVVERDALLDLRSVVREIPVPAPVRSYASRVVEATHPDRPASPEAVRRFVRVGASPRAAQALVLAAKVRAALDGRSNAAIADVRWAGPPALRHRVVPSFEGEAEGVTGDHVVQAVLDAVPEVEERVASEASRET
jgi:MoxR-like ATPase